MSQRAVKPKNNQPHKAKTVKDYLEEQELQVLPHPPYSPDLWLLAVTSGCSLHSRSGKEDLLWFLPYMGMAAMLVM